MSPSGLLSDGGVAPGVNARTLQRAFEDSFSGTTAAERRVVARQSRDLAASGKAEADRGHELTVEDLVDQLQDAPDDCSLAERWNWWMGALEVAHGGYRQFQVQVIADDGPRQRADEDLFR